MDDIDRQNDSDGIQGPTEDLTPADVEKATSRLSRVVEQVRGLSEDVVELVELKLQLVQVQLEERFEGRINEIIAKALVAVFALAAVSFALIAAAIGLGYLFENQALGFLSVAVILGALTIILWRGRFRFIDFSENHENAKEHELEEEEGTGLPRISAEGED